jgi:hypothetical protein
VKEASISQQLIQYINSLPRARAIKMHSGAQQGAGEPDIFACIAGFMVVIETKRPGERLRRLQGHILKQWTDAGAVAITTQSLGNMKVQLRTNGIELP